jgi:aminomuconate-semialdehyde/2-hydroxymuconate-6-semialdehyde dehydrogenase
MQISSFINKSGYSGSSTFTKLNPFTHETLHEVKACDLMGLVMAIQAANKGFADWKEAAVEERKAAVQELLAKLESGSESFAKLEALDQGLPLWFVRKYSVEASIELIKRLLQEPGLTRSAAGDTAGAKAVQVSAVGVIAIIASWNLSLKIILQRLIPAVLAGNAVIVKVSSQSPVTAHILSEIASGLPVSVLVSDDDEVKKALVAHPGVKAVSFAGRIESASDVITSAAKSSLQSYKKLQVSSGTKNSAVMLGEPDDVVFKSVMESFLIGQGQLAWNSARLFVLEKHEDLWQERIQQFLADLKPSEGIEDSSMWTPTLKFSSFEKFGEIKHQATDDQAKLLESGYKLSSAQLKTHLPVVFTKDMSRCSTLQQDQIHSPFFILSAVKYPFDVAKYSNVSYFGFAAHLWGDEEKLGKVAGSLDVGLVTYNKSSVAVASAFSGQKQSGYGLQDFSPDGLFYSNLKSVF